MGNPTSIYQGWCPYCRKLWSESKRLLELGKINNYFISSGKIKNKLKENGKPLVITHVENFLKYFGNVNLTQSS